MKSINARGIRRERNAFFRFCSTYPKQGVERHARRFQAVCPRESAIAIHGGLCHGRGGAEEAERERDIRAGTRWTAIPRRDSGMNLIRSSGDSPRGKPLNEEGEASFSCADARKRARNAASSPRTGFAKTSPWRRQRRRRAAAKRINNVTMLPSGSDRKNLSRYPPHPPSWSRSD